MLDRTTPPPVRPFGQLALPPMERIALDNGLALNVYNHSYQDVSELAMLLPGGVVEALGAPVASMLVAVMPDGSHDYPGSALSDLLDFNGAKVGSSVTDHHTTLSLRMLNSHWNRLLPAFADMLMRPQLSEQALDLCRQRMANGAAIAMQRVEHKARRRLAQLVYGPDHPKAVDNTPERILAATRHDFADWHDRLFRRNLAGAELFLAGRVTPAMVADVNRTFGTLAVDATLLSPCHVEPFRPAAPTSEFVESEGALQSAVRMAIPTIPRTHPDYITLRCAVVALGGYFGSRLMTNIREDKGYTYGIQAGLLGSPEGALMLVETSADNAYVEPLLAEIRAELARLQQGGGFVAGEIDRLRQYLMSNLAQQLDTAFSISSAHQTERVAFTGPGYFARQWAAILAITPESLADVARRHLSLDRAITVVAGARPDGPATAPTGL